MKGGVLFFLFTLMVFVLGCQKDRVNPSTDSYRLSYGDSIFYLKEKDYVIQPLQGERGIYSSFPGNLALDPATGKVTITEKGRVGEASQMGLRYRIYFTSQDGSSKDSTTIVLAGSHYQDQLYYLSRNEAIGQPIYNGNTTLGTASGIFTASDNKIDIDPGTGRINFEKTIANGFFSDRPENHDWKEVKITQHTRVGNENVENSFDVVIYYYDSVNDIPYNVTDIMRAHQDLLIGIQPVPIPRTAAPADESILGIVAPSRPKPPCIIIVGN